MIVTRYRPWFRRSLLAANCALPPVMLAALFTGSGAAAVLVAGTALAHGLLLWAIMYPRCAWLGPVVCRFATEERKTWLTIDDGPTEDTPRLLAELARRGVRATFFLIGERAGRHPEVVRAILDHGHTLGNHTATHPRKSFWCCGARSIAEEVDDCDAVIRAHPGARLFRPPVGHKPPALRGVLAARGAQLVMWSCGGRDGWVADPACVVRRVVDAVSPGAIILLHEGRAHSVATILAVVDALRERGWEFTIPASHSVHPADAQGIA